jgi:putative sterol carrier protein
VIRYLSLEWIDAVASEIADDQQLAPLAAQHSIGVTQLVTDGPEGDVLYHLQVDGEGVGFGAGPADPEDVRMEQTWHTAVSVATGQMTAQDAFIGGHIRFTGDQQKLIDAQPVFGALDGVFTSVRQRTEYR